MPPSSENTMASASKISVAVLLSRLLGVIRESLFAHLFGCSIYAEAYVVAYRIPNLLRDLFAEGALSSAFVPTFTQTLKKEGKSEAFHFANLTLTGLFFLTGFLVLLASLFTSTLVQAMAGSFQEDPVKYEQTLLLTRILLPTLTLISLSSVFMGLLNSQKKFFLPALAPALFNVVNLTLGALLCLSSKTPETLILWWSIFTLIATFVQLFFQIPASWKTGWRPAFHLKGFWKNTKIRQMASLMLPAVLGVAIVNINVFINTIFASTFIGGVAYLYFAFRLFYLPVGVVGVAFGTVATSRLAEFFAEEATEEAKNYLSHTLILNWMLSVPCTLGLAVLSLPIVKFIFERGHFTSNDSAQTSLVLWAYLIGLVPYASIKIIAPTFFALHWTKRSLLASLSAVLTNILFNVLTYQHLGPAGIALGTSLATYVNLALLFYFLRQKIGDFSWKSLLGTLGKITLAATLMSLFVALFYGSLVTLLSADFLHKSVFSSLKILLLFTSILLAILIYFPLCRALKIKEVEEVFQLGTKLRHKLLR